MKKVAIFLFSLFFVFNMFGQEKVKFHERLSVKIYANSYWNNNGNIEGRLDLFTPFSPAISLKMDNENFHELEFKHCKLGLSDSYKDIKLGLEYTYNWGLTKKPVDSKINFYLGFGIGGIYDLKKDEPTFYLTVVTPERPYKSQSLDLYLTTIPRVSIRLSKNCNLDLSMPIDLYSISFSKIYYRNRIIEDPYPSTFFKRVGIKIGLGFKF